MLFCDMDGVLADFDRGYFETFGVQTSRENDNVDWKLVRRTPNFFQNLPPMPDFDILWNYIKNFEPVILTGIPSSVAEAADNKRDWIHKYIGDNVEVRCCMSRDKCRHAIPGDVLIDDWTKYKHKWIDAGGIWITHTSALNTIEELQMVELMT